MAESNNPIDEVVAEVAEQTAERRSRWQVAGRALRHRNFQLFFSGQLISLIGTWMQTVAQSWLVYRMTGSGLLLGAVGFASQVPVFLVAPIGGITADRMNRQRVVIATQTASMILALILAALTLTHTVRVWHIFVPSGRTLHGTVQGVPFVRFLSPVLLRAPQSCHPACPGVPSEHRRCGTQSHPINLGSQGTDRAEPTALGYVAIRYPALPGWADV